MIYVDLLMAFPGWTWEYVDRNITLHQLNAIYARWEVFPPIHCMVAQYFGLGKSKDATPTGNLDDLLAFFPH